MRMRARTITAAVMLATAAIIAPAVSASAAVPGWPTLNEGDSGRDVRSLQLQLMGNGFNLTVDGIFGPETKSKVKAYQGWYNKQLGPDLAVDGIAGPATLDSLTPLSMMNQGNYYTKACEWQAGTARDSVWDADDVAAWKAIEQSFGMAADGLCDKTSYRGALGRAGGE